MEKETKKTCNQCMKQMINDSASCRGYGGICTNPKCPNYALVQIPLEQMPTEKPKKRGGPGVRRDS